LERGAPRRGVASNIMPMPEVKAPVSSAMKCTPSPLSFSFQALRSDLFKRDNPSDEERDELGYERIIDSDDVDVLDALGLEFGKLLDVTRNLVRARTAECSGYANNDVLTFGLRSGKVDEGSSTYLASELQLKWGINLIC
jgi:hypothetical protein